MAVENVRIWRPEDTSDLLLMSGNTTSYAVDPRDEYVFGIVTDGAMRSSRGGVQNLVTTGQAIAWDPTARHTGAAVDQRPWQARLMIIKAAELRRLASDKDDDHPVVEILFPNPVIDDPALTMSFLHLHRALEQRTTPLEREERLGTWLRAVTESHSTTRTSAPTFSRADHRALDAAVDYLAAHSHQNVGLDELATIAQIGKFRLLRLFQQQIGVSPHALHIAYRIRAARRLLEVGETIAQTAIATGFTDQSHLHRHFTRSLGITPAEYQRRIT